MDTSDNSGTSHEKLFKEIVDNYSIFRRKVDEYFDSTTKCKASIKAYSEYLETYSPKDEEEEKIFKNRKQELEEMMYCLPQQNSMLLTLFVGDFNVVLPRKADKIKYKKQYEKFKLFYIIGQLIFSSLNMLCGGNRIVEGILQFYLVWFYCNLTMKESILTSNGSRIRTWWLVQHYLDIILYALLLIRFDGEFSFQFSAYIFFMSVCQVLQFYYQAGSLYKLSALGRAKSMEVSAEGLRVKTFEDLRFLAPFLILLYTFQLYNGFTLLRLSQVAVEGFEVLVCGILFFMIASGNIYTLIRVIMLKHQIYDNKKLKKNGNNGVDKPAPPIAAAS